MKPIMYITLIAIIMFTFSPSIILSQAVGQKPQLFLILDITLKTSAISEYEATLKEYINLHKTHNFPYTFYGYTTNDFHYYQFFPVENYADIDDLYKEYYEVLANKAGNETWQSLVKGFSTNSENLKRFTIQYLPELSYNPENQVQKPEDNIFSHWVFCYMKRDKEQEFQDICKEWANLFRRKNSPSVLNIFAGHIGTESPLYILQEKAVNVYEFYRNSEKLWALLGDESKVLWGKTMAAFSKIERQDGTYRPDLSYIAEK